MGRVFAYDVMRVIFNFLILCVAELQIDYCLIGEEIVLERGNEDSERKKLIMKLIQVKAVAYGSDASCL